MSGACQGVVVCVYQCVNVNLYVSAGTGVCLGGVCVRFVLVYVYI